jgi:hypothetical protein
LRAAEYIDVEAVYIKKRGEKKRVRESEMWEEKGGEGV